MEPLEGLRESLTWGLLILSALLTVLFLIIAGVAYWAGARDLSALSGVGALASAVLLPSLGVLVHLEARRGEREGEREGGTPRGRSELSILIMGFLGVMVLYAGFRMVGIVVEQEIVAVALLGIAALGIAWILMRSRGEGGEELVRTIRELSEKVDRLSRLLEE